MGFRENMVPLGALHRVDEDEQQPEYILGGGQIENPEGKFISKEILENINKMGNFYVSKYNSFLVNLPDKLYVPSFREVLYKAGMTEAETIKGYESKFYTEDEARGLVAWLLENKKNGTVWYNNNEGRRCRAFVYDYGQFVRVHEFNGGHKWNADSSSFFYP
ncbi:MAG: hypothetical protein V4439_00015 [Patescibacteria group bacterium]